MTAAACRQLSARICSSSTLDDWMRIFLPFRSAGALIGVFSREGLETVVPVSQAPDALGLELGQQLLADDAVGDLAQGIVAR